MVPPFVLRNSSKYDSLQVFSFDRSTISIIMHTLTHEFSSKLLKCFHPSSHTKKNQWIHYDNWAKKPSETQKTTGLDNTCLGTTPSSHGLRQCVWAHFWPIRSSLVPWEFFWDHVRSLESFLPNQYILNFILFTSLIV
jgi:hypothetical protein